MSFSHILPPSLGFYLQFGDGGSAAGPACSQQMCKEFMVWYSPGHVTAAVLGEGAAPEKSSAQSCPEHVPASWEPAAAGGEAAAALRNQLWVRQSSSACSSGSAALGLPQAAIATCTQCHSAVVISLPRPAQIMFWESLLKSVFMRCVSLIFELESRQ